MTWYWSCNCCVWVEATKCAGNTAPPELRVFVHQDNLPTSGGTKIFSYGGVRYEYNNCWRINPDGPRVALPPGAHKVNPSTTYDSCSECEDDVDEPPSDGGPGGGGGGPGGGGPGGPGGGGPGGGGPGSPGDGESEFVKLVVCSEHAGLYSGPDLYTRPPDEERFVRLYGYCFRVPTGPTVDEVPDGAQYAYTGGSYDDCHDCTYGKKARLCPDQEDIPGYDDAPEIWVRSRDLPEETIGFTWGSFCYELRASDPEEVVPIDAFILNPRGDFADCSECRVGVQCQPCPNEPDVGYEVWVEAKEAEPFSEPLFFRYRAVCYSLDPSATPFDPDMVVVHQQVPDGLRMRLSRHLVVLAVANLVKNAYESFMERHQHLRGGEIAVTATADDEEVHIVISDNGMGMAAKDLDDLASGMPRRRNKAKRKSTGFGVPIARRYVEAHGGTLAFDSNEDVGTTVTITLPRTRRRVMEDAL